METNDLTIQVLNDLIRINNDRIAGYKRAINETKDLDIDLKSTFNNLVSDSEQYKTELSENVVALGGTVAQDSTLAGKIYRAWMDVKATFTGKDRHAILDSCEYGEDAAQAAYRSALSQGNDINADTLAMIEKQQQSLKLAHDLIKKYRDAHASLK
jgi:uncharacterized protein (TIGR02284 family)